MLTDSTNKRKSDGGLPFEPAPKKAKASTGVGPHAAAKSLVVTILAAPDTYPVPSDANETRELLRKLASYAHNLDQGAAKSAPAPKTKAELQAAAEKVKRAAISGIRKQMTASCQTRSAEWSYDGLCADPDVFATLMGLLSKPTWKMKKIPKADFENLLDNDVSTSVRYDTLIITSSNINVCWSESTGEFKFSGTYGCDR